MRALLIGLVAVCLVVASYLGYSRYENARLIAAVSPHVKNATVRLRSAIDSEVDPNTNITFKEYFARLEGDISEIENRRVEVETLANQRSASITTPAIAYLKAAQEYLRASLHKDRKRLQLTSARNQAVKVIAVAATTSGFDAAIKSSAIEARKNLEDAARESNAAVSSMVSAAEKLKLASVELGQTLPSEALLEASKVDQVVTKVRTEVDSSVEAAK